ncbi:hypothetical protein SLS56_002629 [Neofusicoccum ribis]|uniref:ZZ-type domain-containing protein n=1 Tax=Neofusicoccum ribis TaxID=45134 RepID=A0ABR3T3I7_9PEZI
MVTMTFSELSGDTSDIGDLWTKAIEDYCRTTERDIKQFRHLSNTDALLREQEEELSRFSKFRHNGQTTDKLRHLVSKNSDLIMSAAKQISAAASAVCHPELRDVLDLIANLIRGHEMIMTFFDIQHSFLERISIIESKIPTVKAYQTIMMRVFSSILALSSIATKYAKEGRFLKWAKALWKGTDENLKGALDGLNTNIQRLESATMFATLGQTIETHRSVTSIGSAVNENLTVTRQVLASQQETSAVLKEHAQLSQEHFEVTKQMSVTQDKHHNELQKGLGMLFKAYTQSDRDKAGQEPGKGEKGRKSRDAGARRSAALAQVKAALQTTANPTMEYAVAEIRHSFVEGTFQWLPENEAYRKFAGGDEEPLLWVTGDRGLGKSSLACFAVDDLRQQSHLYKSTVASFFFKEEHEELRSTVNLLRSVAAQVAESDIKYREEVATEVKKIEYQLRDDDGTLLWERLFASKFPNSSETRLFLVVDGLDEADGDDRKKLLDLFKQIKKDGLQIRVLLTSGSGLEGVKEMEPASLPLTTEHLKKDVRQIIRARIKSLTRLRRLRLPVRKRIAFKLQQKADSVLYVEHVLRRLNSLGREAVILKELEKLPDSLSGLYSLLLAECQKGRGDDEFASLKRLFAWLAYSKRPLTLGEASNLVALKSMEDPPDLEKTSYAHRGIGLVLKWFDHYEAALEECRMSLENPSSVFEQFQALGSVADAAIHLAEQEDDEEKRTAYIKEAREAVNAEADLLPQLGPRCEEKETKAYLANGFSDLAKCALLEDDVEAAITVVNERAVPLFPEDSFSYFYFGGITDKLDEKEQHDRLVELFSGFRDKDKLYWLSSYSNNKDNHEVFQRAAAKSGKQDLVVETCQRLLKLAYQLFSRDLGLRYELADYYYRVIGDRGKARELLEQVMESSSKGEAMEEYTLLSTRSHLAELLMEQFRSTVDSSEKASILEEMKKLAFPPDYLLGADFNPHVSNTAIPAALMVRKMGPLLEFQSILNKSFDACIEGLTDAEGWNDSLTIRFFGKLLACLPGLEKDAQIALSSQFYYLNPEFKEQANDSASEASDGEEAGEAGAETTQPDSSTTEPATPEQKDAFKQYGGVGGDPPTGEGLAAADKPSTDDVSLDADIDPECSISCNGCSKEFSSPHQGPIYTCIICTDEDLCADCYNKRVSWSQGEPVTDWRTYCGKDHHYVKHAPDGWKEVKDGAAIIANEKVEFGEWLKQVQERWTGAWEVFWGKEVDIVDIL